MKKLTLLLGLICIAAFTFGQGNISTVLQDGHANVATVKQIGINNDAFMNLVGEGNWIWQCQTGFNNVESFVVMNGNFNRTWSAEYFWTPTNWKFYTKFLYDPSNTQHQFGCLNTAVAYIDLSDHNLVSQTQGYKYFGLWSEMNEAVINITNFSHYNKVMQAQLGFSNHVFVNIDDNSTWNNILTHQKGEDNVVTVNISEYSDGNKVGITQGCMYNWAIGNTAFVQITDITDDNEFVINQKDFYNYAEILANYNSDDNIMSIHQEGWSGNYAHIQLEQWAIDNIISICQWDLGSHDATVDLFEADYTRIFDGRYTYPITCMSSFGFLYPLPYCPFGNKVYTKIKYDPTNNIHQDGYFNHADVDLWGPYTDDNQFSIFQEGFWSYNNTAIINIHESADNAIAIYQTGESNTAEVIVGNYSDWNELFTYQVGVGNMAYINAQNADNNFASIVQGKYGSDFNTANIFLSNHDAGTAVINQFWYGNNAEMNLHDGFGNMGAIYQRSYMSNAWMDLAGTENWAAICQHFFGYHNAFVQITGYDNGFNKYYDMYGPSSPWFVPFNPGYYCGGQYFKVWNEIYYDPTNMVHQEGFCQWGEVYINGGAHNRVSIFQEGDCCCCGACGGCVNNVAVTDIYDGFCNATAQYQNGQRNYSFIDIDNADFGKANTFQVGVENIANIQQFNGEANWAGVLQYGDNHNANISQTGTWNQATTNQFNW